MTVTSALTPGPFGNLRPLQLLARSALGLLAALLSVLPAAAATATATTLTASSATVSSGTAVTLTAYVHASSGGPYGGQVAFCDAAAAHCTDIHQLGVSPLLAGYANFKFTPGPGAHTYKAVFLGNTSFTSSTSTTVAVSVTPLRATTTTVAQSGSSGSYSLSSTVSGAGGAAPTGTLSFLDTSNANYPLGTATLAPSAHALSFTNPQTPATGNFPDAIVTGDFDGDGKLDLAVSNYSSNSVTILLGNGDGTFTFHATLAGFSNPNAIVVADFNNDGKLDLAVLNSGTTQVWVLLGTGGGNFGSVHAHATGGTPEGLAAGDFNNDGTPDLAITNGSSANLTVLLGQGDGTFTSAASPSTGNNPTAIAVADFDNDGNQDLAVTDLNDGTATVLFGAGNGTFPAAVTLSAFGGSYSVVTADLNGDGNQDFAVADYAGSQVTIFLGAGNRTFTSASVPTLARPIALAIGDFNGDGIPDLAAVNEALTGNGSVSILLGKGDGTFQSYLSQTVGADPRSGAAADFNADGVSDLAAANYQGSNVTILLAQPTQAATASGSVATPVGGGTHQVIASYPGDTNFAASASPSTGLVASKITGQQFTLSANPTSSVPGQPVTLTAAISPYTAQGHSTDGETVTFNTFPGGNSIGTGTLASGVATLTLSTLPVGTSDIQAIYSGDSNFARDASNDLSYAVSVVTHITLATGYTSAAVGTPITLTATVLSGTTPITPGLVAFCDAAALHCTDVHRLGTAQLTSNGTATLRLIPAIGTHTYKAVFLGTTGAISNSSASVTLTITGLFPSVTTLSSSGSPGNYTLAASVVSLTRSPLSGTVSFTDTSNANASLGSATIPFSSSTFALGNLTTLATGTQPKAVATGDFNGDGKPDFVVANYGNSTLTVQLGNGDGTFTAASSVSATLSNPDAIAVGDFNNDGRQDLAVANYGGGTISIFLGNGDGTFAAPLSLSAVSPQAIVTADFNNDGIADLAVATSDPYHYVYLFLGRGDGTFSAGSVLSAGNYPTALVAADFNNDGFQDIAVTNVIDRTISVFFGAGNGQFPTSRTLTNTGGSYALATADLDADGKADLIALDSGGNTVTILRGDGTGAFTPLASPVTATNPMAVAVGDLNGDGIPDLVTANNNASTTLNVFFGNGDGTFQAAIPYATGVVPFALALADFNADGFADPLTANFASSNASVLLAQTTQTAIVSVQGVSPTGTGTSHAAQATYPGDSTHAASTSNTVTLNPLPFAATPTFSPAAGTYTSAQTVTLTSTTPGPSGIYYTTDGSAPTTSSPQYTAPISVTATETIRAFTAASGYQNSPVSSAAYTIVYPPTITAQPASQTINSGASATLTVSANGSAYQWYAGVSPSTASPVAGAYSPTYTTPPLTSTSSFWVQVNNTSGVSANSNTAVITVITPPTITNQPASQTINSGSTATLTVSATGTAPLSYQWYTATGTSPFIPIANAASPTYTTPALTATALYQVQVGNSSGVPATSATATITVITPPSITNQPASQTINSGASVTLAVSASGTAPLSYKWYAGSSPSSLALIAGATASSYTAQNLTATTFFQVQVGNSSGVPATSAVATITVITKPTVTTQPASQTINTGSAAILSVAAAGTSPTFQWYAGSSGNIASPIAGATGSTYTTPTLTATSSFWARASNQAGTADSSTATITVIQTPTCTLSVQPTSTALTVVATSRCTDPQSQPLTETITWGDGSSSSVNLATHTNTHAYTAAGAYAVTLSATNTAGLIGTTAQRVSPNQSPVCTLGVVQGQISTAVPTVYPVTVSGGCTGSTTLSLDWGDGTPAVTPLGPPPYTYTYPSSTVNTPLGCVTGTPGCVTTAVPATYNVVLTGTDASGLKGSSAPQPVQIVPAQPIPAGGSTPVSSSIAPPPTPPPAPIQVTFVCSSVSVMVNNQTVTTIPSAYGISCTSPAIPLGSAQVPVNVTITTSSGAVASHREPHPASTLALCGLAFPFAGLAFLVPLAPAKRRRFTALALVCAVCFSLSACGGYFQPPPTAATPTGLYYITLVETVVNGPAPTGFVQTSLIVPLPVTH